ncbi:hypothetical protein AMAG_12375 [Allomyces macrogynus ATCC 38327]|uniref:EF-hand domain-containing protein n=1 Tax=Allomyces macrogynus (strain ATCC 38327) TaxID=578462 RepID=A0A0L0SY84_ALLM3|nr:hypothetical protein AMAG_12375 [Allomyces macrogynus ATCC 38327]|eukprot:KNE67309.1 hypothetical protein AMAG_12375 [Allomyces macrogynus ATCC 38327]
MASSSSSADQTPRLLRILAEPAAAAVLAEHLGTTAALLRLRCLSKRAASLLGPANDPLWDALLDHVFPCNARRLGRWIDPVLPVLVDAEQAQSLVQSPSALFRHLHALFRLASQSTAPGSTADDAAISSSLNPDAVDGAGLTSALGRLDLGDLAQIPEISSSVHDQAKQAFAFMATFEKNGDVDELHRAVVTGLQSLAQYPFHPGLYYVLGFAASVLGLYHEALSIVEFGLALDPTFEDMTGLKERLLTVIKEQPAHHPLLSTLHPPILRPAIAQALRAVFAQNDRDRDGAWTHRELRDFIGAMNGARPDIAFCQQFARMFGADVRGFLIEEGFLEFFAQQSANEPDETLRDLERMGISV